MKTTFTFIFLLITALLISQDIDNNDISFQYIRLPKSPLNKNIKNYKVNVVLKYTDMVNAQKDAYQKEVMAAEEDYKKAMDAQLLLQKNADQQYEKEMEAWNKKPMAEQIAFAANKPVRKIIPAPVKNLPKEPVYPKMYDAAVLSNKYFNLQGYTNAPQDAVNITVTLLGYDSQKPKVMERVVTKSSTTNGVTSPEVKKYFYAIPHKHMMSYKIETPSEGLVAEIFPEVLDQFIDYKTQEFDSIKALNDYWDKNQKIIMEKAQDQILSDNLNYINETINDTYGFSKVSYATLLSVVDEKKGYQDYKEAYVAAENGYKAIVENVNRSSAVPELQKAISLWENAMKESQPNNKKARVDGGVTEITILNLIEAYIWINDFTNSKAYIDKMKTMDPSKKARRRLERMEQLYKSQKERYELNK